MPGKPDLEGILRMKTVEWVRPEILRSKDGCNQCKVTCNRPNRINKHSLGTKRLARILIESVIETYH